MGAKAKTLLQDLVSIILSSGLEYDAKYVPWSLIQWLTLLDSTEFALVFLNMRWQCCDQRSFHTVCITIRPALRLESVTRLAISPFSLEHSPLVHQLPQCRPVAIYLSCLKLFTSFIAL